MEQNVTVKTQAFPSVVLFNKTRVFLFYLCDYLVCICTRYVPGTFGGQKRALDPLELELQKTVCDSTKHGCWEVSLYSLQKHPVFLTAEPSLQLQPL